MNERKNTIDCVVLLHRCRRHNFKTYIVHFEHYIISINNVYILVCIYAMHVHVLELCIKYCAAYTICISVSLCVCALFAKCRWCALRYIFIEGESESENCVKRHEKRAADHQSGKLINVSCAAFKRVYIFFYFKNILQFFLNN